MGSVGSKAAEAICQAAKEGNTAEVRRLHAEEDAKTSARDKQWGLTPLHLAAERGHAGTIAALLEMGADIEALSKHKTTPLGTAVSARQAGSVRALIEGGADHSITPNGSSLLNIAVVWSLSNPDLVVALAEAGVDVGRCGRKDRDTPLVNAVERGRFAVVRTLVAHGALLSSSDPGHPAHAPAPLLITAPDQRPRAPLCAAVEGVVTSGGSAESVEMLNLLLELGADVDSADSGNSPHRTTALITAIRRIKALRIAQLRGLPHCHTQGDLCWRLLLAHGADIGKSDDFGVVPLLEACKIDDTCSRALVEAGADVTCADASGCTPLIAAIARGCAPEIVSLLIEHGADVVATDHRGGSPLCCAAMSRNEEILPLVLAACAGADIDVRTESLVTPLWAAAESGRHAAVRALADRGADINAQNARQWTPLCAAASHGFIDVVCLLIDLGADLNTPTCGLGADLGTPTCGRTALQIALDQPTTPMRTIPVTNTGTKVDFGACARKIVEALETEVPSAVPASEGASAEGGQDTLIGATVTAAAAAPLSPPAEDKVVSGRSSSSSSSSSDDDDELR